MRQPAGAGNEASSGYGFLTTPAVVVVLVLLIGATFFLWRARYIRRKTAYVVMAVLLIALILLASWIYSNPMTA